MVHWYFGSQSHNQSVLYIPIPWNVWITSKTFLYQASFKFLPSYVFKFYALFNMHKCYKHNEAIGTARFGGISRLEAYRGLRQIEA